MCVCLPSLHSALNSSACCCPLSPRGGGGRGELGVDCLLRHQMSYFQKTICLFLRQPLAAAPDSLSQTKSPEQLGGAGASRLLQIHTWNENGEHPDPVPVGLCHLLTLRWEGQLHLPHTTLRPLPSSDLAIPGSREVPLKGSFHILFLAMESSFQIHFLLKSRACTNNTKAILDPGELLIFPQPLPISHTCWDQVTFTDPWDSLQHNMKINWGQRVQQTIFLAL